MDIQKFKLWITTIALAMVVHGTSGFPLHKWMSAHATFYGGRDGVGTFGGACGYGDLYNQGYGLHNAALSTALFNGGESCGGCYAIMCDSTKDPQWCVKENKSPSTKNYSIKKPVIVVTATNFCPPNYALPSDNGGWCNPPLKHFDMSVPAFLHIAHYKAGIVPILYTRVKCKRSRGILFMMHGSQYFILVLVSNVGGVGEVRGVWVGVKMDNNNNNKEWKWQGMVRNWGQNWQAVWPSMLLGKSLSFRVETSDGKVLTSMEVAPPDWRFGQTYVGNQYNS